MLQSLFIRLSIVIAFVGIIALGVSANTAEAKASSVIVQGSGTGSGNLTASCVNDFFTIAKTQYNWSPQDVVYIINHDGDPNFQVSSVGDLRQKVANGEIGIFDTSGNYHICSTGS